LIIGDGTSPCEVVYDCRGWGGFWSGETLIIGDATSPCDVVDDGRGWGGFWSGETFTDTVPDDIRLSVAGVDSPVFAGVVVMTVLLNTRLELVSVALVKISIFRGDGGEAGTGVIEPKLHIGVRSDESAFPSSVPGS
jgi:hypothetical protein